jgi:hypothetical protein
MLTLYVRVLLGLATSMSVNPTMPDPEVTSMDCSIIEGHLDFDRTEPSTWWPSATDEERKLLIEVYVEESVNTRLLKEEYEFPDDIIEDIMYVSLNTSVDPLVLGSIVDRESGGKRQAANWCKEWGEPYYNERKERWEKKCVKLGSCYSNCQKKRRVWKNHLDIGLWQLRDVVERVGGPENSRRFSGWSWLRSFNKGKPRSEWVKSNCAMERFCSREAMIHAVWSLMEEQIKLKDRVAKADCRDVPEDMKWLGLWNGCKSARNHTRRSAVLKERRKLLVHIAVLYHQFRLATDDWPLIGDFPHLMFNDEQSA